MRRLWPLPVSPNGNEIILDNKGVVEAIPIQRKGVVKD